MPRLFVAVDVPPLIREQLARLAIPANGVKWVSASQIHLTLRFIGSVSDEEVETIQSVLENVKGSPFELRLAGVGRFPPKGKANVLWAGIEPTEEVRALAARVEESVVCAGLSPEEREFSPHVTLARLKEAPPAFVEDFIVEHGALESDAFPVDAFTLYSSLTASSGATYSVLRIFPL